MRNFLAVLFGLLLMSGAAWAQPATVLTPGVTTTTRPNTNAQVVVERPDCTTLSNCPPSYNPTFILSPSGQPTYGSTSSGQTLADVACWAVTSIPALTGALTYPCFMLQNSGGMGVSQLLGTWNGWTPLIENGLSTTVKAIKGSAGQLGMIQCYNPNTSQVYVQVFNVVSGSVTLGTTTPTLSIPIAPTATGGYALSNPGIYFSTAMSAAATTTATGSTAPSTAADCNVAYN